MAENINLDVGAVLTVIANLRDRQPDAAARTIEVLRLILNREGFLPSDVHAALEPINATLKSLIAEQQSLRQQLTTQIAEIIGVLQSVKQQDIDAIAARIRVSTARLKASIQEENT